MIRFTFNEVLTKRAQISKHDGVRLLSYNDVLAYVGHPMMPVSLNGQIKDVWENVYKRGEQRRVLTQHVLDLFNLRLSQASSTNARGNLLDHNFICYYINEVLNNLKGPILKKNKSEELRSVSIASKRKYRHAEHAQHHQHPPAIKTLRPDGPIHPYPMAAPPHVQPLPLHHQHIINHQFLSIQHR
jgi:hypothetical protein